MNTTFVVKRRVVGPLFPAWPVGIPGPSAARNPETMNTAPAVIRRVFGSPFPTGPVGMGSGLAFGAPE